MNIKQSIIQTEALTKLSRLRAGALFMKMGTGKTKVALDLIRNKEPKIDLVIWLAPSSLIKSKNYQDEISKWKGEIKVPFSFYSIEGVSLSDGLFLDMVREIKEKSVFCIIDESLSIKNIDSKRTARMLRLWNHFSYRIIMNGTPVTKSLLDLHTQMNFLHPKILNLTEAQFANKFLSYIEGYGRSWRKWSLPENEKALIEIIRPYIFDADLDIPARLLINEINVKLTPSEELEYEEFKQEILSKLKTQNKLDFMNVSQLFQQKYTMFQSKFNSFLSIVLPLIKKREKVLIFVKFLKEVETIVAYLRKNSYTVYMTGETSKSEPIQKFQCEADVLVCTYGTGNKGLNLQFCHNIIFFSQTFDWGVKEQSLHRVYRNGQKQDVHCFDFYCNTGLEKLIKKSLNRKESLSYHIKELILKESWEDL